MRPSRDELLSAIERLRSQAQADKEMLAYRKNEVAAGIREAEALRTRNAALVAALRAVEWGGTAGGGGEACCPSCYGWPVAHAANPFDPDSRAEPAGHTPDCPLDAALRAAEGETK